MDSFGAGKPESNQAKRCANQVIPAESTTISADFVFLARAERHAAPRNPLQCSVLADKCAGCQTGTCGKQLSTPSISADFVFMARRPPPVIQVRQHIWMEGCLWKQRNTGHTQQMIQLCAAKDLHYKSSQVVAYNSDTDPKKSYIKLPTIHSTSIQTSSQVRSITLASCQASRISLDSHHRSGQSHWLPAKQ
jgi:hypothetical protein